MELDADTARDLVKAIEWRFSSSMASKVRAGKWKLFLNSVRDSKTRKWLSFRATDQAWLQEKDHCPNYRIWRISDKATSIVKLEDRLLGGQVLELPDRSLIEAAKQILANGIVTCFDPEEGSSQIACQLVFADLAKLGALTSEDFPVKPDLVFDFEQTLLAFSVRGQFD